MNLALSVCLSAFNSSSLVQVLWLLNCDPEMSYQAPQHTHEVVVLLYVMHVLCWSLWRYWLSALCKFCLARRIQLNSPSHYVSIKSGALDFIEPKLINSDEKARVAILCRVLPSPAVHKAFAAGWAETMQARFLSQELSAGPVGFEVTTFGLWAQHLLTRPVFVSTGAHAQWRWIGQTVYGRWVSLRFKASVGNAVCMIDKIFLLRWCSLHLIDFGVQAITDLYPTSGVRASFSELFTFVITEANRPKMAVLWVSYWEPIPTSY